MDVVCTKTIENAVPTVAAVYDRRVYTLSDSDGASCCSIKPAVIDRRYSGTGSAVTFCAKLMDVLTAARITTFNAGQSPLTMSTRMSRLFLIRQQFPKIF